MNYSVDRMSTCILAISQFQFVSLVKMCRCNVFVDRVFNIVCGDSLSSKFTTTFKDYSSSDFKARPVTSVALSLRIHTSMCVMKLLNFHEWTLPFTTHASRLNRYTMLIIVSNCVRYTIKTHLCETNQSRGYHTSACSGTHNICTTHTMY